MLRNATQKVEPHQLFLAAAFLTLGFRLWLSTITPFTGDEAYFIWWGQWPDWGYHDHPPMIGWLFSALLPFGQAEWWLRLPLVFQPLLLGLLTAALLRPRGNEIAWTAALLVLLAPPHLWHVFITTDTPLVYFSVLSGCGWLWARRAEEEKGNPWPWYVLAGFGLAGAVLSKYFAALLGFAFLVDTLVKPTRRKFGGLLLVYAMTLPGIALMAWWNAGHCWGNIMFNFYNRHHKGIVGLSWQNPALYAGMMLYLLTPACFWYLARQRTRVAGLLRNSESRALVLIGTIPLLVFAPLSLVRSIGLHWVLSFLPFILIALALSASPAQLHTLRRFFVACALLHVVLIVVLANTPIERWQNTKYYPSLVLTVESQKVLDQLEPYSEYTWMMDGYSNAVTLGINTYARNAEGRPHYIGVFGEASSHARHDDILTDMRSLDGGKIAILRKTEPKLDIEYTPYFQQVGLKTFEVRGAHYWLVLGDGFNYPHYRDVILARVKQLYYAIPPALPQTACYFCDRYFPGQPCKRPH